MTKADTDLEEIIYGKKHKGNKKWKYLTIFVLVIIVALLAFNFATQEPPRRTTTTLVAVPQEVPEQSFLTPAFFTDTYFEGLVLPFAEGTEYQSRNVEISKFIYVDFTVPENTDITASIPGEVTNVIDSENFNVTYVYVKHPAENFYLLYTLEPGTVIIDKGDIVERGQKIATTQNPIVVEGASSDTLFRLGVATIIEGQFPVPDQLTKTGSQWATGKPMFYKG